MRHIATFPPLGTLDSMLALCWGGILNSLINQKSTSNVKTQHKIIHKKDSYLLRESWNRKAECCFVQPQQGICMLRDSKFCRSAHIHQWTVRQVWLGGCKWTLVSRQIYKYRLLEKCRSATDLKHPCVHFYKKLSWDFYWDWDIATDQSGKIQIFIISTIFWTELYFMCFNEEVLFLWWWSPILKNLSLWDSPTSFLLKLQNYLNPTYYTIWIKLCLWIACAKSGVDINGRRARPQSRRQGWKTIKPFWDFWCQRSRRGVGRDLCGLHRCTLSGLILYVKDQFSFPSQPENS